MAIPWDLLEYKLNDYFEKGKDDKFRTYEQASIDIENMYNDTIRNQGQDQYGNYVLSLNKFALALTLRQGFKSAVDVPIPSGPKIEQPDIEVPKIDLTILKIPNLDIPNLDIPRNGLPSIPSISGVPSMPSIPSVPSMLNVPSIPNVPGIPSFELPSIPGMPSLEMPKIPEIKFNPMSLNFNDFIPKILNTLGLIGLQMLWSGVQVSLIVPPPGSVRVINNVVVNPGSFPTMNLGSSGSTLTKELINGFKQHARTVSGMITSLVYSGTTLVPVQFPWTGIN